MKNLRHPHIVEYIESFVEDGVLIIIMEYCEGDDWAIKEIMFRGRFGILYKKESSKTRILGWKTHFKLVFATSLGPGICSQKENFT